MLGGIEDVKTQIAAVLNSELAGANGLTFAQTLTAIDAERGGVVTPLPAQVEKTQKAALSGYPACQIFGADTEFDQDSEPTLQDGAHQLVLLWLHVTDDEQTVTTMIERLVLATRQTLWNSTLGGTINAAPLQIRREDYSDIAPDGDNAFLKGSRTFVSVSTLVQ